MVQARSSLDCHAFESEPEIHIDVESNPGLTPSLTEATSREHNVNPGYRFSRSSTLKMSNRLYYDSQLTSPFVPLVLSPALLNSSRNTHSQVSVRLRKLEDLELESWFRRKECAII